jgi:hypothetical protein
LRKHLLARKQFMVPCTMGVQRRIEKLQTHNIMSGKPLSNY